MTGSASYEYSVSPTSYLERARAELLEDSARSLFYAAFELRCFVEARQDLYLDAQQEYARSVPKHWKIGAQGKALEAIFESDRIQRIIWEYEGEQVFDAYHTPVTSDLRKRAEKLGEFLHAQGTWRDSKDKWWMATRNDLLETYEIAWLCNQGSLLSPMFLHNGTTVGKMMMSTNNDTSVKLKAILKEGAVGTLNVDYPQQLPDGCRSDICHLIKIK